MGINAEMFYDGEAVEAVKCAVCLDVLDEPQKMSNCTHHFCGSCIEEVIATQGEGEQPQSAPCPTCRVVGSSTRPSTTMLANILNLPTKCWYHLSGCDIRIPYGNFANHARHCSQRPMPCPRDCGLVVTATTVATHLLTCDKAGDALTASLMCYECRYRYLHLGDRPEHCDYYRLASKVRRDYW